MSGTELRRADLFNFVPQIRDEKRAAKARGICSRCFYDASNPTGYSRPTGLFACKTDATTPFMLAIRYVIHIRKKGVGFVISSIRHLLNIGRLGEVDPRSKRDTISAHRIVRGLQDGARDPFSCEKQQVYIFVKGCLAFAWPGLASPRAR